MELLEKRVAREHEAGDGEREKREHGVTHIGIIPAGANARMRRR
jgi:hypothetical protein